MVHEPVWGEAVASGARVAGATSEIDDLDVEPLDLVVVDWGRKSPMTNLHLVVGSEIHIGVQLVLVENSQSMPMVRYDENLPLRIESKWVGRRDIVFVSPVEFMQLVAGTT